MNESWYPYIALAIGLVAAALVGGFVAVGQVLKRRIAARFHELLAKGAASDEILEQLVAEGHDRQLASEVVDKLVSRILVDHPAKLLDEGCSRGDILKDLLGRGMGAAQAEELIDVADTRRWYRRWRYVLAPIGAVLCLVGVAVLLFGLVVRDGNRTGKWVTFPYAGTLTLLAGTGVLVTGMSLVAGAFGMIG